VKVVDTTTAPLTSRQSVHSRARAAPPLPHWHCCAAAAPRASAHAAPRARPAHTCMRRVAPEANTRGRSPTRRRHQARTLAMCVLRARPTPRDPDHGAQSGRPQHTVWPCTRLPIKDECCCDRSLSCPPQPTFPSHGVVRRKGARLTARKRAKSARACSQLQPPRASVPPPTACLAHAPHSAPSMAHRCVCCRKLATLQRIAAGRNRPTGSKFGQSEKPPAFASNPAAAGGGGGGVVTAMLGAGMLGVGDELTASNATSSSFLRTSAASMSAI